MACVQHRPAVHHRTSGGGGGEGERRGGEGRGWDVTLVKGSECIRAVLGSGDVDTNLFTGSTCSRLHSVYNNSSM